MADISNEIENIGLIYDIENVKAEHLQYIADLIGFKLRGILLLNGDTNLELLWTCISLLEH